jgi:hypothetical protein
MDLPGPPTSSCNVASGSTEGCDAAESGRADSLMQKLTVREHHILSTSDTAQTLTRRTLVFGGVPVYLYQQTGMEVSDIDHDENGSFIIWLPTTWTDQQENDFVSNLPGHMEATLRGHPSEKGISYVAVVGNLNEIKELLEVRHPGEALYVESDLPVHVIPEIPSDLTLLEEDQQSPPWGLDRVDDRNGLDNSYDQAGSEGDGVHVYVMDTGVHTTHADFGGRAIPTLESVGSVVPCSPTNTTCAADNHGHGTHCAGTIAGSTYGIAKRATIHAVKVLNPSGATSWILGAVDWVLSAGARPAVISMSLGGPGVGASWTSGIDAAVNGGIVVVLAAGNSNSDACQFSPAYVTSAITVGSTTSQDTMSGFSNYGSCVDIFAPGTNILSARNADTGSTLMSGTSMACPHVAGAAALLFGENPSLTSSALTDLLLSKASFDKIASIPSSPASPNKMLYTGTENPVPTSAPTPAPPPTPMPPTPMVVQGSCTLADGCATSLNYPGAYGNGESCTIRGFQTFHVVAFNTEQGWDKLWLNDEAYSGSGNPPEVELTTDIFWSSDGSVTNTGGYEFIYHL